MAWDGGLKGKRNIRILGVLLLILGLKKVKQFRRILLTKWSVVFYSFVPPTRQVLAGLNVLIQCSFMERALVSCDLWCSAVVICLQI